MPSFPSTLALEFSQRDGSIAMMNSEGKIECKSVSSLKREEDDTFSTIDEIKKKLQMSASDVELVIVNTGPGGFTGLRTSVSIAKMISLANNATIVPVEAAVVCAEHANIGDGPFLVISSVKRKQFWLSKVQQTGIGWECESANSTASDVNMKLVGIQTVFADEYIPEDAQHLIEKHGVAIHPIALSATALLRVGVGLFHAGISVDPSQLLPTYSREPEAVRKWKTKDSTNQSDKT